MILGIDHVAMSCKDIASASDALSSIGLTNAFTEPDLPNHPEKKPFLSAFTQKHSIAYFKSGAIAAELTFHEATKDFDFDRSGYSAMMDIPEALAQNLEWSDDSINSPWGEYRRVSFAQFQSGIYARHDESAKAPSIAAVCLRSNSPGNSAKFWEKAFGFTVSESGQSFMSLEKRSFVPAWSGHLLILKDSTPHAFLDSPGCPCLALVASSASADSKTALSLGAIEASKPFLLSVNGTPLEISMLRGPSGEIVELISTKRAGQ